MTTSPSATSPDLILFGGTFDPPHQGHVDMAAAALAAFPDARLWALPAPAPAGADGHHKQPVASYQQRLAMAELAFAPLAPRVEVSPLEAGLEAPHYTLRTLQRVAQDRPDARLAWLVGQDQLADFPRWHEPQAVLALALLIVIARLPRDDMPLPGAPLVDLADEVAEKLAVPRERLITLSEPVSDAASRAVRQIINQGKSPPTGWLPPAVARYIADAKLYAGVSS